MKIKTGKKNFFHFYLFTDLVLAALVFVAIHMLSPVATSRSYSPVAVCGLLSAAASLVTERTSFRSYATLGSVAGVPRFSYSSACGIFLDKGLVPCIGRQILNHWNSLNQESPPNWLTSSERGRKVHQLHMQRGTKALSGVMAIICTMIGVPVKFTY